MSMRPHTPENPEPDDIGLLIFSDILEEADALGVPQTIDEYAIFTGAPMHRTIPDNDPRRPDYHGLGLGFPHHDTLPKAGFRERRLTRHFTGEASRFVKHWRVRDFAESEHGQRIVRQIMAAANDGKLDPNKVFRQTVPPRAVAAEGSGGTQTLVRQEVATEQQVEAADKRGDRFFCIGLFLAGIAVTGLTMFPLFSEQPDASGTPSDTQSCTYPDMTNDRSC